MPTYEYRCKSCGRDIEAVQSFTDDALTTCEVCGGDLRKVFGNIGVTFKGSGFYRTDSRSSRSTAKSGDGKGDKTDKTEKTDKKADAKESSAAKESSTAKRDSSSSTSEAKTA